MGTATFHDLFTVHDRFTVHDLFTVHGLFTVHDRFMVHDRFTVQDRFTFHDRFTATTTASVRLRLTGTVTCSTCCCYKSSRHNRTSRGTTPPQDEKVAKLTN